MEQIHNTEVRLVVPLDPWQDLDCETCKYRKIVCEIPRDRLGYIQLPRWFGNLTHKKITTEA